ncbi:hypothetical protein GCM10009716_16390 [Streptomyces sodiiphilus]|uniref:Nitroreductase n=1 Tax=Streptomyces sodiiphilus TaxID=226217 RepID=A0ABN2P1W3_9ACTN
MVLTVTARRTVSHYGHRAWPLLLLDTGHAVAALRVAAGRAPVAWDAGGPLLAAAAGLPEARVWRRLWPRTEPEHPLAAVLLTPPGRRPPAAPLERWARQGPGEPPLPSGGPPGAPLPAVQAEAERVLTALTARTPPGPERWDHRPLPSVAAAPGEAAERRSATPPLPGVPAPDGLLTLLRTAEAAGGPDLRWCAAVGDPEPCLLRVTPGAPERRQGHPGALAGLAAGDARPALAAWAAGQAWVAGCGAVLLASGCPSGAAAGQVRRAHLRAGHAVQLAQSAAARLGLPSRPLGSWQRADLGSALGGPRRREWIIHGLALGAGRTERSTPRR